MHGHGHLIWPDGKQYIGEFEEDQRHGQGKFYWSDGREYEGSWVVGKQSGVGYFTDENGIRRKGMWLDGIRKEWLDESVPNCNDNYIGPNN